MDLKIFFLNVFKKSFIDFSVFKCILSILESYYILEHFQVDKMNQRAIFTNKFFLVYPPFFSWRKHYRHPEIQAIFPRDISPSMT
jgi:hypothetical protein